MTPFCAAADWGTSSFRLWLLDEGGHVLAERRSDEGMSACVPDKFAGVLNAHLAAVRAPQGLPVVICGMAGSRQGWIEAPYCTAPVALGEIAGRAVRVPVPGRSVHIVPGVAQRDPRHPDVMRGEETQLIGAFAASMDDATVCMPGSHSKWVSLRGGAIQSFRTYMTGEFYAAVRNHTVLRHAGQGAHADAFDAGAFEAGVQRALEEPQALTALLFGVRAGELLGYCDAAGASSRISGLVIGTEIAAALGADLHKHVHLVSSGVLAARYSAALAIAGREVATIDADTAVRAGLHQAAVQLDAPVPQAAAR